MLFADGGHLAQFYQAADYSGCDVWAIRIIADIGGQHFLAAVWGFEAGLDGYPGHVLALITCLLEIDEGDLRNGTFVHSGTALFRIKSIPKKECKKQFGKTNICGFEDQRSPMAFLATRCFVPRYKGWIVETLPLHGTFCKFSR
jgi:hypothetical protein